MILPALIKQVPQLLQLLGFIGAKFGTAGVKPAYLRLQMLYVREEILRSHPLGGVGVHAVHVGYDLEGSLLRCEQPVDRAVLVHLPVILPEILHEVLRYRFAEAFLHVVQVLHMVLAAHRHTDEVGEAQGCIVGEAAVAWHERHDAVVVDFPCLAVELIRSCLLVGRVGVGNVQPRLVESVASKHAAHGITDELLDDGIIVPYDMFSVVIVFCHNDIPFYHISGGKR